MIAPKGGRPKQFTAEQARERQKLSKQRYHKKKKAADKRKREAHAALVVSEKKAKEDLAQSRADNVKLAGALVRAAVEIRRLVVWTVESQGCAFMHQDQRLC